MRCSTEMTKNGEKAYVLTRKDTECIFLLILEDKGCKCSMCYSCRIYLDIME